jgi:hypothetical protein
MSALANLLDMIDDCKEKLDWLANFMDMIDDVKEKLSDWGYKKIVDEIARLHKEEKKKMNYLYMKIKYHQERLIRKNKHIHNDDIVLDRV